MYNGVEFILANSKYSARNANYQINSVGRLVADVDFFPVFYSTRSKF